MANPTEREDWTTYLKRIDQISKIFDAELATNIQIGTILLTGNGAGFFALLTALKEFGERASTLGLVIAAASFGLGILVEGMALLLTKSDAGGVRDDLLKRTASKTIEASRLEILANAGTNQLGGFWTWAAPSISGGFLAFGILCMFFALTPAFPIKP